MAYRGRYRLRKTTCISLTAMRSHSGGWPTYANEGGWMQNQSMTASDSHKIRSKTQHKDEEC